MNVAKSERLRKEKNPAAFCPNPKCLWRASSGNCPKHQKAKPVEMTCVGCGKTSHETETRCPDAFAGIHVFVEVEG